MTEEITPVKRKAGRPPGTKSKPMTPRQQAEAAALWAAGEMTLPELAKKYGKAMETMSRLFERMGVKKGSRAAEVREEVQKAVQQEMISETAMIAQRIRGARDDSERFHVTIRKLALHEIVTAKKQNVPLGTILPNLKALEVASKIAKLTQEGQFASLGIINTPTDNEDDIPDLKIEGLSSQQITDLRNQMREPDPDDDSLDELEQVVADEESSDDLDVDD